jgi:hypothetical protein
LANSREQPLAEVTFMRDTVTSHFWLGHFPNEGRVAEYFKEVYGDDDDEPISQFARDQGAKWYDHDFMGHGFKKDAKCVEDLVNGYSYCEQWSAEIVRRAAEAGLSEVNTLIFISKDEIDKPRSVDGDGYSLRYVGTIRYRI